MTTTEALQKSIAKWQAIVDGRGKDNGHVNCDLCKKFYWTFASTASCIGCPVMKQSGQPECLGTPYQDWSTYMRIEKNLEFPLEVIDDHSRTLAQAELDFLKSLPTQLIPQSRNHLKKDPEQTA